MMHTKKLNKAGGVCIPVDIRRDYGIEAGDALDIEVNKQGHIILKSHLEKCIFCGSTEEVMMLNGKGTCETCIKIMEKAVKEDV